MTSPEFFCIYAVLDLVYQSQRCNIFQDVVLTASVNMARHVRSASTGSLLLMREVIGA